MKTLSFSLLCVLFLLQANSQVTRKTTTQRKITTQTPTIDTNKAVASKVITKLEVKSHDRRTDTIRSLSTSKNKQEDSPFAGGIHAAKDAARPFDSAQAISPANANHQSTVSLPVDTIHNVNTAVNNGVNTTSGAVDRSGQAQFGQTNWGRNERNTIGESQWTIPPPVTSTFRKEYPDAASTTWRKNLTDSSLYFARYRSGANWAYSTYNASGERLSTHIEIPLVQAPRAVSMYLSKQPAELRLSSIARLQMPGKPEVYEIKTSGGKTIYVNDDGAETKL